MKGQGLNGAFPDAARFYGIRERRDNS
jgi:hypothetical protein